MIKIWTRIRDYVTNPYIVVGAMAGAALLSWLGNLSNSLALNYWALPRAGAYGDYTTCFTNCVFFGGCCGGISGYIVEYAVARRYNEAEKVCFNFGCGTIAIGFVIMLRYLLGTVAIYINGPMFRQISYQYPTLFDVLPAVSILLWTILLFGSSWWFHGKAK